ncbi:MAG: FAD-dependent oxidoreductase [Abitibacteriaceae bacterium]|nr:FAD-dependent oxidoreductase [Abditibacteriaceae bacterium]MBV9866140.1 FAD-dependent oxidoreductase [Abditibacteriaceae bacterium]
MAKPILLTVDDDPGVLRAVERDLRSEFGENFRVLRADSGATALDALNQLKQRNETVALFLVDQRMPEMNGVEFLEQAMQIFPEAKRVLLTAYADTDAAIKAINTVRLDHYLMKPWDPPEENLYPVLNDVLEDWQANYRPPFEGIRVIGNRWSSDSHRIKDFLARNQFPYQWMNVESDAEACSIYFGAQKPQLPYIILPDSTRLENPGTTDLAERIGLRTRAELPFYDLLIVGGGPAGLAAAVYGASEGLRTVLIEREAPGGQAGTSSRIENYLGFPVGLSGADLARRGVAQAKRFGVEILAPQEVSALCVENQYRMVKLADGGQVNCHAMIIATGVSYRKLDVPGIESLTGSGVYYGAAMTEAIACRDDDVFIVGGANSAGQAAIYFSKFARQVTMLVRGDSLTKSMSQYLIDEIEDTPNIKVLTHTNVAAVKGDGQLSTVTVANSQTGTQETLPARALFIFIGAQPRTDWLAGFIERDDKGFVLSGPELMQDGKRPRGWQLDRDPYLLETNVPGVFVAGDVRHGSVKRVASSVGEGSIAVQFVHQYLAKVGV